MKGFTSDFANMLGTAERLQDVSLKNLRMMWEKTLQQIAAKIVTSGIIRLFAMMLGSDFKTAGEISQGLGFYNQGGQVRKYNTGGYVAPQMFSGGGYVDTVPSMLTEGEFIMNRRAVDSIGIENLNRMNRTGSAGQSVNVTFEGNVMSQDFIESEAIPKIKDAIRRGADIGMS